MNTDVYRVGKRGQQKRRRRGKWLVIFVLLLATTIGGRYIISHLSKPQTTLSQAHATTTKVSYSSTTKHYDEPDFVVDLPANWQPLPRPTGPYQSYNWQLLNGPNGELITIYEDTIPTNFAVNRAVIVAAQADHVSLVGSASDNCSTYTKNAGANAYRGGAPAKWQGVDFLCDQSNQERDVLGTSSTDGINTVVLKSPGTGRQHKFFFTYTDHTLNPDYTVFYGVLNSFHLK